MVEHGIRAPHGGSPSVLNNFSVGRDKEKPHLFIFISSLDYDLGRVKHALIKRVGEALVTERSSVIEKKKKKARHERSMATVSVHDPLPVSLCTYRAVANRVFIRNSLWVTRLILGF